MLVLSVDSTALSVSVVLSEDEKFLAGTTLNIGNKHSTTLLPAIKFILDIAGKSVSDIDLIALVAGPGSFTGVRIGAAAVKGLCLGREIPCIGVSSLETMARGYASVEGIVCPMINARRDRYFTAYFMWNGGSFTRITDDDTLSGDEIEGYLASLDRPVYLCGDGAELFLKAHSVPGVRPMTEMQKFPCAYYAGIIAREIFESSEADVRTDFTAEALRPIYLRQPQAERELEERLKGQN